MTRDRVYGWMSIMVVAGAIAGILPARGGGRPNDPVAVVAINLKCAPASRGIHCQLLALRDVSRPPRDVTAEARWRLSGAPGAQISPGGVIEATEDGDVKIEAQYQSHRVQAHARLTHDAPGQVLAVLRGRVYVEMDGTLRPVAGAHVEVVGGPSAGTSTATLGDGSYEFVGLVPGQVMIRATKVSYTAADNSIQIHPGDNRVSLLIGLVPPTTTSTLRS